MNKVLKYALLVVGIVVLILLILFGNSDPQYAELTPEEYNQITIMRKEAYDYALQCGGTHNNPIPFEQITWIITPGSELKYQASDGVIHLKGYFSPSDSTIYIPYTERETFWIATHESLHALGWMGHPNIPFRYPCEVMADQHP